MILHEIRRPNSLKKPSPAESPTVATYPLAGGWHGAHRCVFQGRKARRVATNVYSRKTSKKLERYGLRILGVKGSGVVFTHGEGISTPRVRHKGWQPLIKCAISCPQFVLFSLFYIFIFLWSTRVFPLCRNLPFRGRATRGLTCASSKGEKRAESPPTFIWGKCRKNRKRCGLRTLSVKGSGVVFTHGEGISTPRVRHKGRQPLIKCANMT